MFAPILVFLVATSLSTYFTAPHRFGSEPLVVVLIRALLVMALSQVGMHFVCVEGRVDPGSYACSEYSLGSFAVGLLARFCIFGVMHS